MIPNRLKRVNHLLQREISDIVRREVKDPRVAGVASVTEVVTAADLSHARVYISMLNDKDQREAAIEGLSKAADFIRSKLRGKISLRHIPELRFFADESIERGVRIAMLISQVNESEKEEEPEEEETEEDKDVDKD
jgi:ribosome-binding factor A